MTDTEALKELYRLRGAGWMYDHRDIPGASERPVVVELYEPGSVVPVTERGASLGDAVEALVERIGRLEVSA